VPAAKSERFDAAYYARFYGDRNSRVSSQRAIDLLANFVFGYLGYLQQPVHRVLDVGCGLGHWQAPVSKRFPRARYVGMELSAHLCEQYGWLQGSIAERAPRGQFDLVICQGVLQYLDDAELSDALDNIAKVCRGALYLEALTSEDWKHNVDRARTDGNVHLRPADLYRKALTTRGFVAAGGGVFLADASPAVLFELEKAGAV